MLHQEWADNGLVYVTFALPNLRRAIVAIPYDVWVEGDHLKIGAELIPMLEAIDPPPM